MSNLAGVGRLGDVCGCSDQAMGVVKWSEVVAITKSVRA
jgi:hypothetical protein